VRQRVSDDVGPGEYVQHDPDVFSDEVKPQRYSTEQVNTLEVTKARQG
jgi:hypothetical protein